MSKFKQEFSKELNSIVEQTDKAVKDSGLYGWNLVTAETPVLTGRARASWLLSVDNILNDTLPETKGNKRVHPDPITPKPNFSVKNNQHLYITNNVDYIEYLEYGTDKINPFAMVTKATPKIDRFLNRRLKNIK